MVDVLLAHCQSICQSLCSRSNMLMCFFALRNSIQERRFGRHCVSTSFSSKLTTAILVTAVFLRYVETEPRCKDIV